MRLFAHDLALARTVYGAEGKEPEMTVKLPKGVTASPGERVILHNAGGYGEATAECEAEVLAVAAIVRPDWTTYRNPRAERQQGSLL